MDTETVGKSNISAGGTSKAVEVVLQTSGSMSHLCDGGLGQGA